MGHATRGEALTYDDARFSIVGLTCASDAVKVEHAVKRYPGIISMVVNPITETVYVRFDPALTTRSRIQRSLEATGYGPVTPA